MTIMPRPYMEYPKWVTPPDGAARIVETPEEEASVMGLSEAPDLQANPLSEREDLAREAERRGIAIDKRWGIERLRLALYPPSEE